MQEEVRGRVFVNPLYMNELQLHREALPFLSFVHFEGVMSYYAYVKQGFQFFNLHIEQMLFPFIHMQLVGETVWYIIPYDQLPKVYDLAGAVYKRVWRVECSDEELQLMGRALVYSKSLFPSEQMLLNANVLFQKHILREGRTLYTHGGCAHFGHSTYAGKTISVAANMATDDWLHDGLPFLRDYFDWVGGVEKIVQRHQTSWEKQKLNVRSPRAVVTHALNLCPLNFACSFLRGLYADFELLLVGRDPICRFSIERTPEMLRSLQTQCADIVKLIHCHRSFINGGSTKHCTGCTQWKKQSVISKHSCMMCLCEDDKMWPDLPTFVNTRPTYKSN